MRVTIITVVYNAEQFLRDCIESVLVQDYPDLEYILIDGSSTDDSLKIAKEYDSNISILISEPDSGMYDALNKGITLATGEVIGILNADDMFVDSVVISSVVREFKAKEIEAVYGDLNYIDRSDVKKVRRKWRSSSAKPIDVALGWMPAHPALFIRKHLFKKFGGYELSYGSAADYELMVRYFYTYRINTVHLPMLMVNMRSGGMSNRSAKQRYNAFCWDYKALKHHKVPFPMFALLLKKLRKIKQFF